LFTVKTVIRCLAYRKIQFTVLNLSTPLIFIYSMQMLKKYEEVVGTIEEVGDNFIAFDGVGYIYLPKEVTERLKNKKGEKVAVIRTDIDGKKYLIREG